MFLGTYKNGNYDVVIFQDGTKIRASNDENFIPTRIESLDCKITNFCDMGCKFCHEQSTPDGEHADLSNPVIDTFPPFTEVAIGGGNPLSHPDLEKFLARLRTQDCIPNITVNQTHFLQEYDRLKRLTQEELIYGLGVSVFNPNEELAHKLSEFPNAVVHTIAGITTVDTLAKMRDLGIKKILLLGYKNYGRGEQYYNENVAKNIDELRARLKEIKGWFKVVSFDNLAIEQLNVKSIMDEEEWEQFYMGNDGCYTMYVDLVKKQYAKSSTSKDRFELLPTINDMFLNIRDKTINNNENKEVEQEQISFENIEGNKLEE